jgi:hypothetical protein
MSAVIIPFAARARPTPSYVNDDTVHACEQLLRLAEAGELSGFAIVGMTGASRPEAGKTWFDAIGLSAADAERCFYPLGRLLHLLDRKSRGEGPAS